MAATRRHAGWRLPAGPARPSLNSLLLSSLADCPRMSDSPARTVLVTGSAKRLGREAALALAAGGWQVAVHFRGSATEADQTVADCRQVAKPGTRIESFQADLDD